MRIREVIEKTGLTDRAVRFYIDEGLVLPDIEESYSGRKSIDFSEKDVERLNNVALLRKAGFSVADIRSIIDDNSTAKDIVKNFIEQTEKNISHEIEIVEKLKEISFNDEVTLEKICTSLSKSVEEKQVPREDLKLTATEKILKIIAIIIAGSLFINAVCFMVDFALTVFDVRYIKIWNNVINLLLSPLYLGWVAVAILSAIVIFKNIGKGFKRKTKGSNAALIIPSATGTVIMIAVSFFFAFCSVTPFCSRTTDPEDYLKLDKALTEYGVFDVTGDLYQVFPRRIPIDARVNHADTVKYFYEYCPCWDCAYGTYDICAEWVLSDDEYNLFKDTLKDDFILENRLVEISHLYEKEWEGEYFTEEAIKNSGYKVIRKGNWTLIYYKGYGQVVFYCNPPVGDDPENRCEDDIMYEQAKNEFDIENWDGQSGHHGTRYDFLICAYNDKEQKARYIASACCGHTDRKGGPYYLSLEW